MITLTSLEVKRQILAAKTSDIRSLNWEKALQYELNSFFQRLKEEVLHELEEYYPQDDEGVLLQGQLDLILAPIFESQQEYYNILREFNIKEYNEGAKQGRRLVKLARKPLSSFKSEDTLNIKTKNLLNASIDKDELFGTSDWTQQKLLDHSFTASERTMNRVDRNINQILSDGYASGAGIKPVANQIRKRFDQLRTWEARRIARTEIHNAHQMGIMNTYQEMGVEYTQWTAARDKRTRTNHRDIDGEIIPLGGTYSNGCQYPGDTNGPIEEWINCRCGNVPFIIPYGYIAPPGKAQFKESDLVQTLEYWNQGELINQISEYSSPVKGIQINDLPKLKHERHNNKLLKRSKRANNIKIDKESKIDNLKYGKPQKLKQENKPLEPWTGDHSKSENYKSFKGTTKDGMLPGNESIDEYFTKNVSTTEEHDEIIEKWVYRKVYENVQLFEACGKNIVKLRNRLINTRKTRSNKKLNRLVNGVINNYNNFEKLMDGAKVKKNIRLHRRQKALHISAEDLEKGETVIHGSRSFSISKEGADYYVGKSKSYIWEVELEAPVGTDACYIAPKAKSKKYDDKFISQMEIIVKDGTRCNIIEVIDEPNLHKVVLRAIV